MADLVWEYWGDFSSTKELMDFYTGTMATYTQPGVLDHKRPKKTVGLTTQGVDETDMLALRDSMDNRGTVSSFTLANGGVVAGYITSFNATPITHTSLYDIKLSIRVDGNLGTVVWEYWGDFNSNREILEFYDPVPGVFISPTFVDSRTPKQTVGLSAYGVPLATMLGVWAAVNTKDAYLTLSTADGNTVSGVPISFSASPIEHTGLYQMKISLRIDGTFSANIVWQFYGSIQTERSLEEFYPAPIGGAYQTPVFYDQKLPKKTATLQAKAMDKTAADEVQTQMDQGPMQVQVFSMADGTVVRGLMISTAIQQIEYTNFYNVHVSVRIQ